MLKGRDDPAPTVLPTNRDDDIPLLVTLLHVPVRLGSLFHREGFINDGFDLSFLNQLFDKDQTFGCLVGKGANDLLLAARERSPQHLEQRFHFETG